MERDTHGQTGEGWVGFDLDGTLAKYDGWKGIDHIGEPVKPMVERIREMHKAGRKVKILTARVSPRTDPETKPNPYLENHWCVEAPDDMPWALRTGTWTALEFIQDWCWKVLGFVPEITHEKDHLMVDLYDDRCHQVVPNTGEVVEEQRDELVKMVDKSATVIDAMNELVHGKLRTREVHVVRVVDDIRWWSRMMWFLAGASAGITAAICLYACLHRSALGEKERRLYEAVGEYAEEMAHERFSGYVEQAVDAVRP